MSGDSAQARVIYVSYDGIGEPLGRSQVLAYLAPLAARADIALVSFEKPDSPIEVLRERTDAAGIDWEPLAYHRRPPVASTAWDVVAGVRAIRRAARRAQPQILHARSYVPALICRRALPSVPLLFDVRGFWVDERVEGGLWRPGSPLYRMGKRVERRLYSEASAVVTLTHASVPQIEAWTAGREIPIEVIPTCAEVDRFARTAPRPGGPAAVWCGSIGTWYRFDLAVRLAGRLGLPLRVLTRQVEEARELLGGTQAEVRAVAPEEVPGELAEGDVGLCLMRSSFSKLASAPTRLAEYLAAGMPVAVSPGVGDVEALVAEEGVGVVVADESDARLEAAAARLRELAADPRVRRRCREVAAERFSVRAGVESYARLWAELAGSGA